MTKEEQEVYDSCQEDHKKEMKEFEEYLLEQFPTSFQEIYEANIMPIPDEKYFTTDEQEEICLRYFNPNVLKNIISEFTRADNKRNEAKFDHEDRWIRETKKSIGQLGGDSDDWVFMHYMPTVTEWLAERAENLVIELKNANLGKKKCSELKSYMKNVKKTLIHES